MILFYLFQNLSQSNHRQCLRVDIEQGREVRAILFVYISFDDDSIEFISLSLSLFYQTKKQKMEI